MHKLHSVTLNSVTLHSVSTNSDTPHNHMQVQKIDGTYERVSVDKILKRIDALCDQLKLNRIDPTEVAKDTIDGLFDGISTEEIDHYASVNCAEKIRDDPQYDKLATALCVSRLHKMTSGDFMEVTDILYKNTDKGGKANPLITEKYYKFVKRHHNAINKTLKYTNDYEFDYFGFKTLERAYLHKLLIKNPKFDNTNQNNAKKTNENAFIHKIIERPQHMWMRVAIGLNLKNFKKAMETYNALSERQFIFGSPTLFNSGTSCPQLSSCFLLKMGDSIEEIYETIKEVALISKRAGGIGISMSNIRASGSVIRGTNGISNGPIPFIQELNWTSRAVNQGGRRAGSVAIYLEPWHADIFEFCELRSNKGKEETRARDIFLGLWMNDLFMKRVEKDQKWSLMCPDECPNLTTTYGEEFEQLYELYESQGKYRKQIRAKELFYHMLVCFIETGMPYVVFKDHVNRQSNQKNIGVILSSNLCSEIVEVTSDTEIAVCNLASMCLPRYVKFNSDNEPYFDFELLKYMTELVTVNLNNVIDINFYPVDKAKTSNMNHRPIGIGQQGLADVFCMMNIPFDSDEARLLNKKIAETIYFGALTQSVKLAQEHGEYKTFRTNGGSPFSHGQLQFHLWGLDKEYLTMGYDWDNLIEMIKLHGVRNSLLTTIMPTASTSQIMGNTEACEPLTSNVYTRSTLAGEFTVVNKYLANKLLSLGLWTKQVRDELIYDGGSIQKSTLIPQEIKDVYKTAYELKNRPNIQLCIDRGPFVDQSQSMNLFGTKPDFQTIANALYFAHRNKLKTGLYYFRSQPAVDAVKFGLDATTIKEIEARRNISNQNSILIKPKVEVVVHIPRFIYLFIFFTMVF